MKGVYGPYDLTVRKLTRRHATPLVNTLVDQHSYISVLLTLISFRAFMGSNSKDKKI